MQVALVQVCVDERLNHELLRIQVRHKLASLYMQAQRILVLNEIGGNFGQNFRNSAELFLKTGDKIVFVAALHHDDCLAAKAGLRQPIDDTIAQMGRYLAERQVLCAISSGHIYTNNNYILWEKDITIKSAYR